MSRFREEHYASRSYKAYIRRKSSTAASSEDYERARRAIYFSHTLSERKAIRKAHKAQARLDAF